MLKIGDTVIYFQQFGSERIVQGTIVGESPYPDDKENKFVVVEWNRPELKKKSDSAELRHCLIKIEKPNDIMKYLCSK